MGFGFQYHSALLTQLGCKGKLMVMAKFSKDAFELLQFNTFCEN